MLNIQDAEYSVKDDTVSRNHRARAYHRRVVRRRFFRALAIATDVVALVAGVTLVWFVWSHMF